MPADSIEQVMEEIKKAEAEAKEIVSEALKYAASVEDNTQTLIEEQERKNAALLKQAERDLIADADKEAQAKADEIAESSNKEMELLRKKAELKTEEATLFVVKTILG